VCLEIKLGISANDMLIGVLTGKQERSLMVEVPKTDATVSEPASPSDNVTVTQTPESTTVTYFNTYAGRLSPVYYSNATNANTRTECSK